MALFLFYLFSSLLLGGFKVGPYSIRVYVTIIMMVYLLLCSRNKTFYTGDTNWFAKKYFVFLIFTFIAFLFNGEFYEYGFDKQILAYYLPCFVMLYSISYYITTERRFKITLFFLLAIIFVNCIVTQLQFIGNPIGKLIAVALTTSTDVQANIMYDNDINTELLFGEGIPIGIFGFVFSNANYSVTFGLLSLIVYFDFEKKIYKYISLGLLVLCAFNCFLIQERTAFFTFVIMAIFLLYREFSPKQKIMLIFLVLVVLVYIIPTIWNNDSMGRLTDFDIKEDSRRDVWSLAFDYILVHPLWGGPEGFEKISKVAPHNYFFNAFITCGLIGGLLAIYLYFKTTFIAIKTLFNSKVFKIKIIAGSYCLYSAGCLFHNASLISGDTLVILLFVLLLRSKSLFKYKTNENSCLHR